LSEIYRQKKREPLGVVIQADDSATDLHFRDMTNKILHAKEYQWRLDDDPKIIAISNEPER